MRVAVAITAVSLLLPAIPAHGHAMLDRAEPRVGSTVSSAPRQLSLWFTQSIEPASSTVEVRDPAGVRADAGRPRADSSRRSLHIPLKALRPGTYRVHWQVLSTDGHNSEGGFSFQVQGR